MRRRGRLYLALPAALEAAERRAQETCPENLRRAPRRPLGLSRTHPRGCFTSSQRPPPAAVHRQCRAALGGGQIKENGRFKKQYKDFIKYHIHVYKEENINFFNFLGLHYKKDAYRFRSNNYLYPGTIDKFIIKNGKITQDGYDVFKELYKYHIKNEQHFNKDNMINESLYDDFHFDYKTLTTFYGNNNCSYVSMKLIYDLLNIEHNFEISDIVKFIITKLDVSYSVFEDENNINFDLPSILVKVLDSKK